MKRKFEKKQILSLFLIVSLLAALMMTMLSCNKEISDDTTDTNAESAKISTFVFEVVYQDGSTKTYDITTDKKTVGEALLEKELISGEDGPYGLYVKTVCGVTVDYDKDGCYWSFCINDEIAMTGVDSTDIVEGTKYSFKVAK